MTILRLHIDGLMENFLFKAIISDMNYTKKLL